MRRPNLPLILAMLLASAAASLFLAAAAAATDSTKRGRSSAAAARKKARARGLEAVSIARRFIGVPYRYGGTSPSGFDCSGLVQYVYGKMGIALPRVAADQFRAGRRIVGNLRPGDLVFFYGLGHVGLYAGGGMMIDANRPGGSVRLRRVSELGSFAGARRVIGR